MTLLRSPDHGDSTPALTGFPDELTTRLAAAVARVNNLDTVADVIDALQARVLKAESLRPSLDRGSE